MHSVKYCLSFLKKAQLAYHLVHVIYYLLLHLWLMLLQISVEVVLVAHAEYMSFKLVD